MLFNISKDEAEQLVRIVNDWAIDHSLLECTGNRGILFKAQQLEPALENWKEDGD